MATPPTQQAADDIKTLKGLEIIRRRPGMYMGFGPDGMYQMFHEVLNNSVNEAMAHYCDYIEITLNADSSITISDNGRGISVDTYHWDLTCLEIKLSVLVCGSGPLEDYMYYVWGGMHGIGLIPVNALSEWLIAEIRRDGFLWRQSYAQGVRTSDVIKVRPLAAGEATGTSIAFLPDSEIFGPVLDFFTYDYEVLVLRCRQIAYLLHGVTIRLIDRRASTSPRETTFHVEGGLDTFVADLNRDRQPLHPPVVGMKAVPIDSATPDENIVEIEFAIQYTDDPHTTELMFVNTLETPDGGTHLTGLRTALTRTLNQWIRKTGAGELKFSGPDTRRGLTAVVSLRHPNPWFESQTSVKLTNKEVRGMVASAISGAFVECLEKHPDQAQRIVDHLRRAADNK